MRLLRLFSLYPNEWFPVLELWESGDGQQVEISDEEILDVQRVQAEFNRIQILLAEKFSEMESYQERSLVDFRKPKREALK